MHCVLMRLLTGPHALLALPCGLLAAFRPRFPARRASELREGFWRRHWCRIKGVLVPGLRVGCAFVERVPHPLFKSVSSLLHSATPCKGAYFDSPLRMQTPLPLLAALRLLIFKTVNGIVHAIRLKKNALQIQNEEKLANEQGALPGTELSLCPPNGLKRTRST